MGNLPNGIVIEEARLLLYPIKHSTVGLSGETHWAAVGQVSPMAQVKAHDGVPWLQTGEVDRRVGLASAVRLHVGVFGVKEFTRTVTRQIFHLVHDFAASVVALSRISFSVLIG